MSEKDGLPQSDPICSGFELITVAGTLGAAFVAGVISYFAGRGMKTHEWRLAQARDELAARKSLYAAYLAEVQRLVIQASEKKMQKVDDLDRLNEQYAEISLVSSKPVIAAAMRLFDSVLLAHVREQSVGEALDFHPRKEAFLQVARDELQSYRDA